MYFLSIEKWEIFPQTNNRNKGGTVFSDLLVCSLKVGLGA